MHRLTQGFLDITGSYYASLDGRAVRLVHAEARDIHGVAFGLGQCCCYAIPLYSVSFVGTPLYEQWIKVEYVRRNLGVPQAL